MPPADSERTRLTTSSVAIAVVVAALVVLGWLGTRRGWFVATSEPRVVVLYCFTALDGVMQDRLLPAFRERWQREQGEALEFVATYAGSGDITKRILAEYPAEVAVVSSELDAHQLPTPWRSWRQLPHGGALARTPLVIVTRSGNPRAIREFKDLGAGGIALLHGDPATSGGAQLAILAEYGAALRRGADAELAFQELLAIWRNVTRRPATAREARRAFESGEEDALVTYAADVIGSPSSARIEGEIVFPTSTIVAEPVVVKIEKNIDDRQRRLLDAFVEFLWSREAQQFLVDYGFESVLEELNAAQAAPVAIGDPFTLADVGGFEARAKILEGVWRSRVVAELER